MQPGWGYRYCFVNHERKLLEQDFSHHVISIHSCVDDLVILVSLQFSEVMSLIKYVGCYNVIIKSQCCLQLQSILE